MTFPANTHTFINLIRFRMSVAFYSLSIMTWKEYKTIHYCLQMTLFSLRLVIRHSFLLYIQTLSLMFLRISFLAKKFLNVLTVVITSIIYNNQQQSNSSCYSRLTVFFCYLPVIINNELS